MNVRRQVTLVLEAAEEPLPAREIRLRVQDRTGQTIHLSTVVSHLRMRQHMDAGADVIEDRSGPKPVYSLRQFAGQ